MPRGEADPQPHGTLTMKNICGFLVLLITLSFVASPQATAAPQTADVIYYNGKIIRMWDARPIVQAVAIRGNKFLRVGSNTEVLRTAGATTRKIDLHGACVVPGLIDSHTHPITAALS
ncbi:MAG: hypothetical protein M3R15_28330, partial [Acidobacteriota bacterium]|nr:hypothetical protein [Acidobacteriota bacterium]